MRWQGAAAAVWAVGAMGLSFRDLDVAVLDGPDLIRLPRLLPALRDEVRASTAIGQSRGLSARRLHAGSRGRPRCVRHADDSGAASGPRSKSTRAPSARGARFSGPTRLCAARGGDAPAAPMFFRRPRDAGRSRWRNQSLDEVPAEGRSRTPRRPRVREDFGADLRHDGLGVGPWPR